MREERVRSIDVPLGPGRMTLRVSYVTGDARGEASIVLACGFGGGATGDPFTRPDWQGSPLHLPASAAAGLIAALPELGAP